MTTATSPVQSLIAATPQKRWTREEYRQLPETNQPIEWEDGELIVMPTPNYRHQKIAARLFGALLQHVLASSLGELLYEFEVDVTDTRTLIPDIIFISDENSHIIRKQSIVGGPDLVIEILSESTQKRDWDTKLKAYQRAGVKSYWIVSQDLTIWEFGGDSAEFPAFRFIDKGEAFSPVIFPELSINLAALMGELPDEDTQQDE